jgi:hypothetical protein
MASNRVVILLAALLLCVSSLIPVGTLATPALADSHEANFTAGEVVMVMTMPISNGTGNSSGATQAPHLVELYTATWCSPCRVAEEEVNELTGWWTAVETLSLHSSVDSPDELVTNASAELYQDYRLGGYPTIVVDGHWLLLGDKQVTDLQSLLTNLSANDLPKPGGANLDFSWQMTGENITINWNLTSMIDVQVDFLISQDGVLWPGTIQTLDQVVRGGLTNMTGDDVATFSLNQTELDNLTLTAVVRISGAVELESGSEIPLTSGLPDSWTNPVQGRTLSPQAIAIFTAIIVILALIPMRHTLPILWRSSNVNTIYSEQNDSEE